MISARKLRGKQSSNEERRAHPRDQIPFARNLFYIDLGSGKPATILNISEGGLAVQAIADSIDSYLPQIRFRFSKSGICVEPGGRIVWANESKDVAGVEFISLSDEGRNQIREWLAEIQTPQAGVTAVEASHPLHATNSVYSLVRLAPKLPSEDEFHRTVPRAFAKPAGALTRKNVVLGKDQSLSHRRPRSLVGLFVILSTAGLVMLLLAGQIHSTRFVQLAAQHEPSAEATRSPIGEPTPPERAIPAMALSDPFHPPKHVPGFVLQVAAMLHEENATALADSLRQRIFPAFVVKSDSDRFYRVYVGPYPDRDSAMNTSNQLVQQGFAAIVRRRLPTQ